MADYTGGAKAGRGSAVRTGTSRLPGHERRNLNHASVQRCAWEPALNWPAPVFCGVCGPATRSIESSIPVGEDDRTHASTDPLACWWDAYLAGQVPVSHSDRPRNLRLADLFCGAGGLTMGVTQLARDLSLDIVVGLAVDSDRDALATFCRQP